MNINDFVTRSIDRLRAAELRDAVPAADRCTTGTCVRGIVEPGWSTTRSGRVFFRTHGRMSSATLRDTRTREQRHADVLARTDDVLRGIERATVEREKAARRKAVARFLELEAVADIKPRPKPEDRRPS